MISDDASEVARRRFAIEPVVFDDFRSGVGNRKKQQVFSVNGESWSRGGVQNC